MINSFGDINVDLIWKNSSSTDSPDDSRDENLTIQVGGAAVNLARSAVAMGEEARFIGKVGNDPFGRFAIEELSKAGLPHILSRTHRIPPALLTSSRHRL